ncbi:MULTISPECIES: sigma-70 family RNA polymerase sigma factor [Micromonospora]|uniref:RNA polymerase sigma factor n=2 Tax=Micromonospora TaxID=1873 RepID=A0A1C4TX73_9ACTN|nr:RNA polymerase subunit sigma [Micromonospora sp. Rc5]SCE64052.1 RNA polymerase sigma-70 factor, ECF subfamily [Micromonospora haikouensis]
MIPAPREPAADGPTDPARSRAPDPATAREPDPATGWALAARDGDPAAQAAFVRATQAEVWRFAAALVDPDTADDLTQETYLRAFRALPAFAGRSSARTWLLGIARRACADHLRVVVRRRRLAERLASHAHTDLPHPDPAGQLGAADLVRRLPAERRGAFVLTQLLGLSYAEAAAVEGVPVGTIRSRVARARHDLVEAAGDALAG